MTDNSPIAVFDSGLGGLSVFSEVVRALPNESVIYYGDGKNCPYGDKTREEVIEIVDGIAKFLISKGAKLIVVACNTATADAIDYLRSTYDVPFVGMEPAVKPAARASKSGVVGILATAPTLEGRLFKETTEKYAEGVKVIPRVGENFVELVEADRENTPEAETVVASVIRPLIEQGADHLVLGCTHYPFLSGVMERIIGDRNITIVNPAPAVARRVKDMLEQKGLSAATGHIPEYEYFTSGDEAYLKRITEKAAGLM